MNTVRQLYFQVFFNPYYSYKQRSELYESAMDKEGEAENSDLEMPQIWVFSKYTNLLAVLSRLKIP